MTPSGRNCILHAAKFMRFKGTQIMESATPEGAFASSPLLLNLRFMSSQLLPPGNLGKHYCFKMKQNLLCSVFSKGNNDGYHGRFQGSASHAVVQLGNARLAHVTVRGSLCAVCCPRSASPLMGVLAFLFQNKIFYPVRQSLMFQDETRSPSRTASPLRLTPSALAS